MRDKIQALAAQHRRVEVKQGELIAGARSFLAELNEAIGDAKIHGASDYVTLSELVPGEYVYGYLAYFVSDLHVCTRTTYDDSQEEDLPEENRGGFRMERLDDVPFDYLESLLTEATFASLLQSIAANFKVREARVDTSLSRLQAILETESTKLEEQLGDSLQAFGSAPLQDNWDATLDAHHLHPADGVTRSSSFVEAVCAEILRARDVPLPNQEKMRYLIETVIANLAWTEDAQLRDDVKRIMSGVSTLCQGIAALRTHYGSAHGTSTHLPRLDPAFAALAKNAGAAVAIFLLARHHGDNPSTLEANA